MSTSAQPSHTSNAPTPPPNNGGNDRSSPLWKAPSDPSLDPFFIEDSKKKEPLELPEPTPRLAEKESNVIQKQLLEEVEGKTKTLHSSLVFYKKEGIPKEEAAQYSREEAEKIIREQSRLNREQADAALLCENDLFIQALAGTGKTSLLSACISYLLALGYDPESIAISSHTVTAAEEIKTRIFPTLKGLFPATSEALGAAKPSTGTIHALAYREMIAHKHPKAKWTILDEGQQFRIWKEATLFAFPDRANLSISDENVGDEMRMFDRVRGYDIPENQVPATLELISDNSEIAKIASIYTQIKEARKLMDYTDLLREWAPIIAHPGYNNKWEYFFVDEFQDTNPLQKFLLKLLKHSGAKLVVCGDSRQSINSFTGSDPTSHSTFLSEFSIQEAWLQTNYRCSEEIIGLANAVIESMMPPEKGRLKAHSEAPLGRATKLVLTKAAGDTRRPFSPKEAEKERRQEADVTCREAAALYASLTLEMGETTPNEKPSVAILYRTNAQGSLLEETMASLNAFRQKNGMDIIPYSRKDYRKTALRNKTEREVLSILRSWTNPRGCDWESILLSPYFHGIGEVTARNIQRKADKAKPSTMEDALGLFDRELSKRNAEGVGDFFDAWEAALPTNPEEEPSITTATKSLQAWIRKSSNTKTYESGSKKEAEEAQRRSYEAVLIERLQQKERNGLRLSEAVDEIQAENERAAQAQNNANRALAFTDQSGHIEKEEGIILSTIHLAKGREYDGVVVHQISEGSLPHFNSLRFYDNETNTREKGFRKYATFPALQKEPLDPKNPTGTLPKIWRSKIVTVPPANEVEAWEDHNNPLEEEKRLLYVAVTRAKKRLVITSRDHNYAYLPERTWEKLKRGGTFA